MSDNKLKYEFNKIVLTALERKHPYLTMCDEKILFSKLLSLMLDCPDNKIKDVSVDNKIMFEVDKTAVEYGCGELYEIINGSSEFEILVGHDLPIVEEPILLEKAKVFSSKVIEFTKEHTYDSDMQTLSIYGDASRHLMAEINKMRFRSIIQKYSDGGATELIDRQLPKLNGTYDAIKKSLGKYIDIHDNKDIKNTTE